MPNEVALKFLDDKITALQLISQELGRMFLSTTDQTEARNIRGEVTNLNQVLFALESARNSLEATANEVPPPAPERIQNLTAVLQQLDSFVSGSQTIQIGLNFLTNVANGIRRS